MRRMLGSPHNFGIIRVLPQFNKYSGSHGKQGVRELNMYIKHCCCHGTHSRFKLYWIVIHIRSRFLPYSRSL